MSRLMITADGDDIKAETMLQLALRTLKLLRALERNITGKRRSEIEWRVDMMSGFSQGMIAFWVANKPDPRTDGNVTAVWNKVIEQMKQAQP